MVSKGCEMDFATIHSIICLTIYVTLGLLAPMNKMVRTQFGRGPSSGKQWLYEPNHGFHLAAQLPFPLLVGRAGPVRRGDFLFKLFPPCEARNPRVTYIARQMILWMVAKSISHHLKKPWSDDSPVNANNRYGFQWFQRGAKWISQPSTVSFA